jgi:FixJ family two-component response regulator
MPGRSGPDLYAEVAAEYPGLKVLFMTGYSNAERQSAPGSRLHPLIRKPFGSQELASAVRGAIDG